jgi:CRISPR-associated protein Csb1
MANHLEAVCLAGPNDTALHPDLNGLPFVVCTTDRKFDVENGMIKLDSQDLHDKVVVTSLTEGHRVASDYFLDGWLEPTWVDEQKKKKKGRDGKEKEETIPAHWEGQTFRERLRKEFGIIEVEKDKRYFIHPEDWWAIYQTVFKYDPNSLVHGILLAKEQIKISRLLTASLEGFGAARVGRTGVKFDRLGKTLSGQPIFAVDEEDQVPAEDKGANEEANSQPVLPALLRKLSIAQLISACNFKGETRTMIYYPANDLFKVGKEDESAAGADEEANGNNETPPEED